MPLFDLQKHVEAKKAAEDQRLLNESLDGARRLLRDIRSRHTSCRFDLGTDMRCAWCRKADDILNRREVA